MIVRRVKRELERAARRSPAAHTRPHAGDILPGNRPSTTVLAPSLTPSTLGQLIALYEHEVFVQGVIWGIDSFDQWGVELGKAQALALEPALTEPEEPASLGDSSTDALIREYRRLRNS